jgi:fructokinase
VEVPGIDVNVVDAVGAGDAFTAAWISATLRGWPLETAARFANRVGGLVASHAGAMPEIADALAAEIEAVKGGAAGSAQESDI